MSYASEGHGSRRAGQPNRPTAERTGRQSRSATPRRAPHPTASGSSIRTAAAAAGQQPRTLLIAAIAVVLLIVLIGQFACSSHAQDSADSRQTEQDQAPSPTATITVTALGDCTLGNAPNLSESTSLMAKYEEKGPEYFFANALPVTGSDDLTIANCEGTFTESTDIQEKQFNFKAPAEYAQILADGSVEAANYANNHSFDYGQQGYDDTKAALSAANVLNFGYDDTVTTEVNGIKVGLFGVLQLHGKDTAQAQFTSDVESAVQMERCINQLKDDGCQLIIGVFHWGVENDTTPESNQVDLAHAAIDDGCDLVIGGHPHVLQGVEYYNGRYICYSMANFCFGGNASPPDMDTMMYRQTFTFENGELKMDDDTRNQVSIVPCCVSSTGTSSNNYQPTPLTGDEGERVVAKVNKLSDGLDGTSVKFSTQLTEDGYANVSW